jgi:two-component system sensor histidine kinase KdpD
VADDFLDVLRTAKQGRLKVFLGMAAGVGKTVAMLRDARRLREEGIEVVCGFVETHGRKETEAELDDLEVIRRKTLIYRDVPLEEMDLDAVLARRPDVAVVDELAHTNVPGSRHEKRYQDVQEILDTGISVLSALNVQHLESLHEIVLRTTGVDVRERVPDRILHRADEIIVVDMAPDELHERLRAGKIYTPAKVERALQSFFRADNLTALRQLALREVANAVEHRARARVRAVRDQDNRLAPNTSVLGVVDAERVMVSMSSQPSATRRLLRHGSRLAGGLNSKWFVVYVRTPGESPERIATPALRSLTDNIRLAKELGAEVVRLEGTDVAEVLAQFARERGITHAVFGRTREPAWRERIRGSLLDRFMRLAPAVDVLVVGMRDESDTTSKKNEEP